jgi:hypothetical protein
MELVGPNSVVGIQVGELSPKMTLPTFDVDNQNTMAADGSATGTVVSSLTGTLLYVYWANAGAFAGNLAVSQVAPTLSGDTGGIYLLGTGPVTSLIRFLGWIVLDAAGDLVDLPTGRLVANYYNRRPANVLLQPGYVDDNAPTTFTSQRPSWRELNATYQIPFIDNGEDSTRWGFVATLGAVAPATGPQVGIGFDIDTNPSAFASFGAAAVSGSSVSAEIDLAPSGPGFRSARFLSWTNNLVVTYSADVARNGGTVDPCATYMTGRVWV